MNEPVKLCIQCQFFYQKSNIVMGRLGFQSRALCASPEALRNSPLAVVRGEPIDECQAMRGSVFACGLDARWYEPNDVTMVPVSAPRLVGPLVSRTVGG